MPATDYHFYRSNAALRLAFRRMTGAMRSHRTLIAKCSNLFAISYRTGNPKAARRAALAIDEGTQVLLRLPEIGRRCDAADETMREYYVSFGKDGYIIRYTLRTDQPVILRLWHTRESRSES